MRPQRRFKPETRDHLSIIAPFDSGSAETERDEMQEPTENDFTEGRRLYVSRQTGFARDLRPRLYPQKSNNRYHLISPQDDRSIRP